MSRAAVGLWVAESTTARVSQSPPAWLPRFTQDQNCLVGVSCGVSGRPRLATAYQRPPMPRSSRERCFAERRLGAWLRNRPRRGVRPRDRLFPYANRGPVGQRDALREQRRRQVEMRLAAGSRWGDLDLVFTTPIGTPLDASK